MAPAPDPFITRVRDTIRRRGLLAGGETVLVAVSAGADSTALLHALADLREALRLTLHVAHYDHGIRPDAQEDARAAEAASRRLGCAFHGDAGDAPAYARTARCSLEDAARRLRYAFLDRVAREQRAGVIATGHTRDDQAETVLLRLLRGSGLRGLGGIPPDRTEGSGARTHEVARPGETQAPHGSHGSLRFIRPLIDVSRADVLAYLARAGATFRDDPTNRDLTIPRNWIRLVLLPLLAGHNPDVQAVLARTADLLRDEAAALDALAAPRVARVLRDVPDGVRIALPALGRLPAALQRRALREAIRRVSGNAASPAYVHIDEARRGMLDGRPDAVYEVPGGVRVTRAGRDVALVTAGRAYGVNVMLALGLRRGPKTREVRGRSSPGGDRQDVPAAGGSPAEYRLDVPGSVVAPDLGVYLVAEDVSAGDPSVRGLALRPAAGAIVVDAAHARGGLILRGPRTGDRFRPFGMGGRSKAVAEFLAAARVPRERRRWVPVVTAADGEVLWLVGLRAAEGTRPAAGADRVVRLTAHGLRAKGTGARARRGSGAGARSAARTA